MSNFKPGGQDSLPPSDAHVTRKVAQDLAVKQKN